MLLDETEMIEDLKAMNKLHSSTTEVGLHFHLFTIHDLTNCVNMVPYTVLKFHLFLTEKWFKS